MTLAALVAALGPVTGTLAGLDLAAAAAARARLAADLGPAALAPIRSLAEAGARDGSLLPGGAGAVRYGRVTKDLAGFSVDAVLLSGAGPPHRHPRGEVDLLFATRGDPRFDGHPEGWAVYPPGSTHVPAVTEGEMLILYFLPGGAIEWLRNA